MCAGPSLARPHPPGFIPNHDPPTVALYAELAPPRLHATGSWCHVRALNLCRAHARRTWCFQNSFASPMPSFPQQLRLAKFISQPLPQPCSLICPYSNPIRLLPNGITFLSRERQTPFEPALTVRNVSPGLSSSGPTTLLLGWRRPR